MDLRFSFFLRAALLSAIASFFVLLAPPVAAQEGLDNTNKGLFGISKYDIERIRKKYRPGWNYSNHFEDEFCWAIFNTTGQFINIKGPYFEDPYMGRAAKKMPPTLTLFSQDIPPPKLTWSGRFPMVDVVFESGPTGGKSEIQTVKALHTTVEVKKGGGAYVLTVPSTAALLGAMEDRMTFKLTVGGKTMVNFSWTGGNAAEVKLDECLRGS